MSYLIKLERLGIAYRIILATSFFSSLSFVSFQTSAFQNGPVLCLFRNLTGLPCPFCGTTRSVGSILQGNLDAALAFNPLGFFVIFLSTLLFLRPRLLDSLSQEIAARWWRLTQGMQISLLLGLLGTLWLFNLPRII
jgi:uncharacterized membrane protein YfcA